MTDHGTVNVQFDRKSGLVAFSIRPPYGLEASEVTAKCHVFELLEIAAKIQLQFIEDRKKELSLIGAGVSVDGNGVVRKIRT